MPESHDEGRPDTRNPFDYARDLRDSMRDYVDRKMAELRDYVDKRNRHRMAAIDTVGEHAAQALADLHRGEARPGWVKMTFDGHSTRIATMEDALGDQGWVKAAFAEQAEAMKWQNRLLIGALIGLCANLIVALTH